MRKENIYNLLTKNLGYLPTQDQSDCMRLLSGFVADNTNDVIFLMTGYAGTGKTSVIASLVATLNTLRQKSVLLAPTGRAAKVLTSYTGMDAYTVHRKIYRQKSATDGVGRFVLDRNFHKETYFIVDEASMIPEESSEGSMFGSGRLLDDLLEYVYTGTDCKLILVGDVAQLPPVGSIVSPALDENVLRGTGFALQMFELRQVIRQSEGSGILMNATAVRQQVSDGDLSVPELVLHGYSDIVRLGGAELIDTLTEAYDRCGTDGVIVVVNSNNLANRYNQGIRNMVFFREEEISSGDLVMVVKNNYYWLNEEESTSFIANGDIAEVKRIRRYEEVYGMRFAEMTLWFRDAELEIDAKVMLDTLMMRTPSLSAEKSRELYFAVLADHPGIKSKRKQYEAVRNDPYYNALQIKFAYAVTCHKSQGGQWERVFIDQGMFNRQEPTIDYLRWFYTALTRATDKVYLVNFPDSFFR
ncbi:MAG TPA: AAA family ATPase [Bacteroidales bacterium]|jgi:exodeoxyribonuclease-5|nr:AAA family ATPase [Bacteroidales bacterium]MDI9532142.1 AAA family ATPase [Bacteroidota bacterium]MBP8708838.1 AAA family ATPase [Bacteroidales bacterium]MZQ79880.1 AAA family ATPase [Bacteroidales bacterium]HNV67105.1 AAA family ATPase [Bacteroidales bacterium]